MKYTLEEVTEMYNKGTTYLGKNNYKKAFPLFKKALDAYEFKEALVNIGNCYRAQGQDKKMMECYERAISDAVPYLQVPTCAADDTVLHAMNNLGLAYYTYGNDDKAITIYNKAIKKHPEFWEAWWNNSTAHLRKASSGDVELFPRAWKMYDARFLKTPPVKLKNRREGLEYWTPGEHVDSIVVLAEQGIGDNIMFGRYLSRLRDYASEVYVQCDPSTEVIFSDYKCIRDANELEHVSCAYPMCSLAGALGTIEPGDWLRDKFDTRTFGPGFNVGIVWSGSPTHANDAYRSVSLGRFRGLAKYANLYSLSPGFTTNKYVTSLDIGSWKDTAECINGLDLVIGVDTSVMHMCGSLGARGWLLQPYKETDFRWGNGVRRSVWYSSIEVYDNPQSWEYVFECVERDLRELVYA